METEGTPFYSSSYQNLTTKLPKTQLLGPSLYHENMAKYLNTPEESGPFVLMNMGPRFLDRWIC